LFWSVEALAEFHRHRCTVIGSVRKKSIGEGSMASLTFGGAIYTFGGTLEMPMPHLLRSSSLTNFMEITRAAGLDPYRQLRQAGISKAALLDPDLMIPAKSVMRLLEESAQSPGLEDLGLRMAETRQMENLGPLAFALREEPTLHKALHSLAHHLGLYNGSMRLRIEETGGVVVLRQEVSEGAPGSLRQTAELVAGVIYRILKQLLGEGWQPRSICFAHRAPASLATHRRVFGSVVRFNQDFDGIVLAGADLDAAIPSYDPLLASHAREFLHTKLALTDANMPDKVKKLVFTLLPSGECVAKRVAEQLGVDRKTMYRHLAYHHQTYSGIVDTVRVDLVQRYVSNRDRALSDVAPLLGFASLSAFSRWFTGRFGCSVSAWRQAQEDSAPGSV
jgi:AraC-like DNA-binding protein